MLAVVFVVSAFSFPLLYHVYRDVQRREASLDGDSADRQTSELGLAAEEARRWGVSPFDEESAEFDVAIPLRTGGTRFPFAAAFAYGVDELPFELSQVNHTFVSFDLGIAMAGDEDYLLIFLAKPVAAQYMGKGWPDAATLLDSVSPADVLGIIENVDGELAVFADVDGVAAELDRLRRRLVQ